MLDSMKPNEGTEMTIVRYNVWVQVEDLDNFDHKAMHKAFEELPGFIESSWEDSYDDD